MEKFSASMVGSVLKSERWIRFVLLRERRRYHTRVPFAIWSGVTRKKLTHGLSPHEVLDGCLVIKCHQRSVQSKMRVHVRD